MSDRARGLVRKLDDFRTRSAAKRELIGIGPEAVVGLIEALSSGNTAVLWCAVSALGDIGDGRAVGPLVDLLAGGTSEQGAVIGALEAITGKRLGANVAKWRRVAAALPEARPGRGRSRKEMVGAAIEGTDISMEVVGRAVNCRVPLPGGRSQQVKVYSTKDPDGEALLAFYTECGPADPSRYEWALRKNLRIPFGRYGIRDVEGAATFVMVAVLPRHSAEPGDIVKTIRTLAEKGDRLERFLREEDLA